MRVLIDTSYALRGPSGTATYILEFTAALRRLGTDIVEVANERRRPPAGGGIGSVRHLPPRPPGADSPAGAPSPPPAAGATAPCRSSPPRSAPSSSTTRCRPSRASRR